MGERQWEGQSQAFEDATRHVRARRHRSAEEEQIVTDAKDRIKEEHKCSENEAYHLLRKISRRSNISMAEVALQCLQGKISPQLEIASMLLLHQIPPLPQNATLAPEFCQDAVITGAAHAIAMYCQCKVHQAYDLLRGHAAARGVDPLTVALEIHKALVKNLQIPPVSSGPPT